MAKKCMYCGQFLAKDDARFCNDCGRPQIEPAAASSGAAAPGAIRVKLPPKEFTRAKPPSELLESSMPGSSARPVAQNGPVPHTLTGKPPLSSNQSEGESRRLGQQASQEARTSVVRAEGDAMARLAGAVQSAEPTPAEEASTMVMPNWREELAQMRQEPVAGSPSVMPEKTTPTPEPRNGRSSLEPPPLPRRAPGSPLTPLPPESEHFQATQLRPPARPAAEMASTERPAAENASSLAEAHRRELRVKVWEQEETIHYANVQPEKPEGGPAPAVEQIPFSRATSAFEVEAVSERETLQWQMPLSPVPTSQKPSPSSTQPPARKDEKQPPARKSSQPIARDEQAIEERETQRWQTPLSPLPVSPSAPAVQPPPARKSSQPLARDESRPQPERRAPASEKKDEPPALVKSEPQPPVKEEQGKSPLPAKRENDIEDLPTARLAVPEASKPSITIERESTPAPKQWSFSPSGDVEDQPTRPLASAAFQAHGPAAPVRQQPAQSDERRPANFPGEGPAPFSQQSGPPNVQPGPAFHPASPPPPVYGPNPLPGNGPVMQGPNSLPGNGPVMQQELNARPQTPYTEPFGQRSPQGPRESLEPRPVSLEAPALVKEAISIDASRKASEAGAETAKRGRKKRTGLTVVVILLLLVLAGGGAATYIERDWVMQFISAPATNQPYQMYQGSSLGISLEYTQGWNVIIDKAHNALRFSDSSYTAQVNLSAAVANGQISDYLNQQSTQLGITGAKAASAVTFAGASWQVVQGSITQKGATYTVVLYATQHGSHFYLLEFLAPPSSFPGMEQSSFAHMRTSLKFG